MIFVLAQFVHLDHKLLHNILRHHIYGIFGPPSPPYVGIVFSTKNNQKLAFSNPPPTSVDVIYECPPTYVCDTPKCVDLISARVKTTSDKKHCILQMHLCHDKTQIFFSFFETKSWKGKLVFNTMFKVIHLCILDPDDLNLIFI